MKTELIRVVTGNLVTSVSIGILQEPEHTSLIQRILGVRPGSYISADILIMANISSIEGYKYALFIVYHASKIAWVYPPMKTRQSSVVLEYFTQFLSVTSFIKDSACTFPF